MWHADTSPPMLVISASINSWLEGWSGSASCRAPRIAFALAALIQIANWRSPSTSFMISTGEPSSSSSRTSTTVNSRIFHLLGHRRSHDGGVCMHHKLHDLLGKLLRRLAAPKVRRDGLLDQPHLP